MADINVIAEQIEGLTLLEASELVKILEEKLGVSAAAASMAVAMPAAAAGAANATTRTAAQAHAPRWCLMLFVQTSQRWISSADR